MMKRLRLTSLHLVLLFFILLLSACQQKQTRVAFLLYDSSDTFISELIAHIEANTPDKLAYEVHDASNSQAKQNQQIVELIEQKVDLLVINAVDRLAASSIVEKADAAGVKIIFFNREPLADALEYSNDVYYVGADADSLGRKQAELAAEVFADMATSPYDKNGDGIIQLVILKGEQGHQDAEKRTENCVSRLHELGYATEVLAIESANWVRSEASEVMASLYQDHGHEIELIFANNDDMALGALDYLFQEEIFVKTGDPLANPFFLIGVDGTRVGLSSIGNGELYGTVLNDAEKQADAIVSLVDYLLQNRSMDDFPYPITNNRYIYIDGAIITSANYQEFTK